MMTVICHRILWRFRELRLVANGNSMFTKQRREPAGTFTGFGGVQKVSINLSFGGQFWK